MCNQPFQLIRLFSVILLITLNGFISAQPSKFSREKYISPTSDTLLYRLLYPDYNPSRKYPLVVFLHGSGERGNDNDAQLKWGVMNFATDQMMSHYPAFVIAPQCPENDWWSNFREDTVAWKMHLNPSPTKSMELVIGLIRQMTRNFAVDTNRIYITGLSMGGQGTFDAITRWPDLFAAAVPVCGGGDISRVKQFAHLPIWMFHGAEDLGVMTTYSTDMLDALLKAGANPGCTIYPEVGHFSWFAAYTDPLMIAWLFRQHR
jgi:predicted peptidase